MKKYHYLLFFYFIGQGAFAQKTVKITYSYLDDVGFQSPSFLFIHENEASFRIVDPRPNGLFQPENTPNEFINHSTQEAPKQAYYVDNDSISTFFFSNQHKSIARFPFEDGKELLYEQENKMGGWKLINESKIIQNYPCKKALIEKNGRKFTVWYTTKIPISFGPLKLNGLPGLILEVQEAEKYCKIIFKSMELETTDTSHQSIKKYLSNKKIQSYTEYEKMMLKRIVGKKVFMANEIAKFKVDQGIDSSGELKFILANNEFYGAILDLPINIASALESIKL
ncbi:GLPGLI family protein [Aquirufa sp. ROCK-SH2]